MRPRLWRELLLVLTFYFAYDLVRWQIQGDRSEAFSNATRVLRWENATGLDIEHAVNTATAGIAVLEQGANLFYSAFHLIVPVIVLTWIYLKHPEGYLRARRGLMIPTAAALVGYWLFPLAPPRFLPGYLDTQTTMWMYDGKLASSMTNQYAAMPSMHVGWALWCGIAIWLHTRVLLARAIAILYPAITVYVVIATANHYVLDVIAGALLVVAGFLILRRTPARPRPVPAASPADSRR
ncbi:phosphatase PAP2 family protein [Streptosporangiaceae bacterium NEAU-GS5]|nr:phosphatase PAP2 family protein [Streptosporangiaceae bacterium NEAU-GS5]